MKRGFLLLLILALLLLASALAPLFKSDPGHVLINFGDWTVETSVLVLATALLVLWFAVQLAVWFWRMPVETARKMREQRALKQLEKAFHHKHQSLNLQLLFLVQLNSHELQQYNSPDPVMHPKDFHIGFLQI